MFMLITNEQCQHMLVSKLDQIWIQLQYNICCMHLHNIYMQEGQIKLKPSFAESYECQQVHIPQRICSELQV